MKSTPQKAKSVKPTHAVAIVYGLNEGPWMGRRLIHALTEAGYTITNDLTAADTIIAHSGGCFIIPPLAHQPRIIMIGLPYRPGRPIVLSLGHKLWGDLHTHRRQGELRFWTVKTFRNIYYGLNIANGLRMLSGMRKGTFWRLPNVTLVHYRDDPMTTRDMADIPFHKPLVIIELPGHHDDCWRNPADIIHIVQS